MTAARARTPELMDQPGLDRREHEHALTALGRISAVSRCADSMWRLIRAQIEPGRPLRILDVACGGGHVAVALAKRMERDGIVGEVVGCDLSPVATDYATALAARAQVRHTRFVQLDVLQDPWPQGFDVVHCSLFLHHLSDSDAVTLLRRMAEAGRVVVVSDLRRTRLGRVFVWAGCRLLTRSAVAREDGLRSVASAFTADEALALARAAGLETATVHHTWPQRYVLTWIRPTRILDPCP